MRQNRALFLASNKNKRVAWLVSRDVFHELRRDGLLAKRYQLRYSTSY